MLKKCVLKKILSYFAKVINPRGIMKILRLENKIFKYSTKNALLTGINIFENHIVDSKNLD